MSTQISPDPEANTAPSLNFIALLRQMLKTSDKVSDLTVIEAMVRAGVLTKEGALPYASNANNLLLRLGDFGGKAAVSSAPAASTNDESMLNMIER